MNNPHRFRNLPGGANGHGLPPEPPGGFPLIGQRAPAPQPVPLLAVIDGMATALLNGPDLELVVAQMQAASALQDGGTTPRDGYVLAMLGIFAKAQAAVRATHAAEVARVTPPPRPTDDELEAASLAKWEAHERGWHAESCGFDPDVAVGDDCPRCYRTRPAVWPPAAPPAERGT